jgi:NADH pyrophosphatase NudC (nudix superfamily)
MILKDALQLLELPTPFTKAQLKKAYTQALMIWHPDRFDSDDDLQQRAHEKTRLVIEANNYLKRVLRSGDSRPSVTPIDRRDFSTHESTPTTTWRSHKDNKYCPRCGMGVRAAAGDRCSKCHSDLSES